MRRVVSVCLVLSLLLSSSIAIRSSASPAQERPVQNPDAGPPTGGSAFHKNDITYSTAVATPHTPWAAKLPGGPIRGFFIPSVEFGRDMAELMQRLDLQPTTVSIDRQWDVNCWGIGDYYGHPERGDRDDFRVVYGYVEKDLTGPAPFDVMVIPGINGWTRMTRPARDAIIRRVRDGAGLVLIHPFLGDLEDHPFAGDEKTGDTRLWDLSPLVDCPNDRIGEGGYPERNKDAMAKGKWEIARPHFITAGVPFALLPEAIGGGSFYKYRADGDVLIRSGDHPILVVKQFGKGRVAAVAYPEQGFLPEAADPVDPRVSWNYWEYEYSLLCRAILWAAGREPQVTVAAFDAHPDGISLSLNAAAPQTATVEVRARTAFGDPLPSYHEDVSLHGGANAMDIPIAGLRPPAGWPQGREILDLIVRDATGATLDWATATFETPRQAKLTELRPAADHFRREDPLRVTVSASGELAGVRLRFTLVDDYDRVLTRQELPASSQAELSYRLTDFLGRFATARVELVDAHGLVVDRRETKPLLVVPRERRAREYVPSIGFSSLRPYFRDARLRQIRAASTDIGMTWTEGVNNGLDIPRGSFGIYWYDRGPQDEAGIEKAIQEFQRTGDYAKLPYNAKRVLYRRTHDKKLLVRIPSFCDPEFMGKLKESVTKSARAKAQYGLDYYFVGDEGSLTSYGDPYDYSWDSYTLSAFREWLKERYGSLEALNKTWKTSFHDWKDVVPYTTEEAHDSNNYAPWADHRTFMEITFASAYQTVRDAVLQGDPDGHIAVSGTQATNAYNGCDWYRLDQVIDDFLSYNGGNQWDLHRSFAKPGAMIGLWTGYGSHGLGVQNAIWNAAIHDVLYPQIFWLPSFLNPDFTHSLSARDMGEAFHVLRYEGVGKLLMESERLQDGIAIHYSMPSVHAAVALSHPKREGQETRGFDADRDGWVRVVDDLGLQFDFLAYAQVEAGRLESGKYRVLVLPLSAALSPREVQEIRAFTERGGIVIADAGAGVMDDHCAWVEGGSLNEFFGLETAPSSHRELTRLSGPVSVTEEGKRWGLSADMLGDLTAVEDVKATTGAPLLKVGDHDAAIVRRVGKGWAIYLNVALDEYSRARRREYGGAGYRSLVNAVLSHLEVRPAVQVLDADGQPLAQAQVVRYRLGDSEALVILKENVGVKAVEGRDGVTVYQDANLGPVASQELTIRLPKRCHVTDVRTGKPLGVTDTVRTSITVGGALVLGLSPAENRLTLTGPASAHPGDHVTFRLRPARAGKTLVRCRVFGPDGQMLPVYARNILLTGQGAAFTLPSALSDPPGAYSLRATDVLTGAATEARLTLR